MRPSKVTASCPCARRSRSKAACSRSARSPQARAHHPRMRRAERGRWRGALAVCAAFLGGALLSGAMESIQTYLPTRVASNLDLAANALGALVGGVLVAPGTSALLDRGLLRRIRFTWFERHAAYVIG